MVRRAVTPVAVFQTFGAGTMRPPVLTTQGVATVQVVAEAVPKLTEPAVTLVSAAGKAVRLIWVSGWVLVRP